jgi:hypothetical protein
MKKSSQIAWKIVPLRHFFPLKVVPLIEVLLYCPVARGDSLCHNITPSLRMSLDHLKSQLRNLNSLIYIMTSGPAEISPAENPQIYSCRRSIRATGLQELLESGNSESTGSDITLPYCHTAVILLSYYCNTAVILPEFDRSPRLPIS